MGLKTENVEKVFVFQYFLKGCGANEAIRSGGLRVALTSKNGCF